MNWFKLNIPHTYKVIYIAACLLFVLCDSALAKDRYVYPESSQIQSQFIDNVTLEDSQGGNIGQAANSPIFSVLGVDDGLPSGNVGGVAQDASGYIWIGTREGLARYDGRRIKVFRHDPEAASGLPANSAQILYRDQHQRFWISLESTGLVELNDQGDILRAYNTETPLALPGNDIWAMHDACQGGLWLGFFDYGLGYLEPDSERLEMVPLPVGNNGDALAELTVASLLVDHQCQVWVGTVSNGVFVLEKPGAALKPALPDRPEFKQVLALTETDQRYVWLGGRGTLIRYDKETGISSTPTFGSDWVASSVVTDLEVDQEGNVWATTSKGIYLIDADSMQARIFKPRPGISGTLQTDFFWSVFEDHEGGLWFSSLGQGVTRLLGNWRQFERFQQDPLLEQSLNSNHVVSLYWDEVAQLLWVGTLSDGLASLNTNTSATTSYRADADNPLALPRNRVRCVYRDSSNRVWVGGSGGLAQMHEDGTFTRVFDNTPLAALIEGGYISDITDAGDGKLWVSVYPVGLLLLDPETMEYTHFHTEGEGSQKMVTDGIRSLLKDTQDRLWLVSDRGLMVMDAQGQLIDIPGLLEVSVSAMHIAANGELWVATDDGLSVFTEGDQGLQRIRRYTSQDGLPPSSVNGIEEDDLGNLWLTTRAGLVRLDPAKDAVRVFTRRDGLPGVEFEPNSITRNRQGALFAGSTHGIVKFFPDRVTRSEPPPKARVTTVSTLDNSWNTSTGSSMVLERGAQQVRFELAVLSFTEPDRNHYRYRLEGRDAGWLEARGTAERTYSHLPPGDYTFRVQAANQGGQWSDQEDFVRITVPPPAWRTVWAYMLYSLMLAILGLVVYRSYQSSRRRKRELALAREREQFAESQRRLTRYLTSTLKQDQLLERIAHALKEQCGVESMQLLLEGEDRSHRIYDSSDKNLRALPESELHAKLDQWLAQGKDVDVMELSGNQLILPMLSGDRINGVAVLNKPTGSGFSRQEQTVARIVMKISGAALENVRLFKQAEQLAEKAERANSAKTEFLASMSHEIRTPLNGVLGMTELLSASPLSVEQTPLVKALRHSGVQLRSVLTEVLDLSKIESGEFELECIDFDLQDLLENCATLFASTAVSKNIELVLDVAPGTPYRWYGDPTRLEQILNNLLSNAVKFTAEGEVVLKASFEGDLLHLQVKDSGIGINEEVIAKLFDAFHQADQSTTRKYGGTGLGLAIARRIARKMRGELSCTSQQGAGSCFSLQLPVVLPSEQRVPYLSSSALMKHLSATVVTTDVLSDPLRHVLQRLSLPVDHFSQQLDQDALASLKPPSVLIIEKGLLVDDLMQQLGSEQTVIILTPFAADSGIKKDNTFYLHRPVLESALARLLIEAAASRLSQI